MSTELYAITNTTSINQNSIVELNKVLESLNQLNNKTNSWKFEIEEELDFHPFNISFYNPNYSLQPTLYNNICVIKTTYNYNFIYQNYTIAWFEKFRNKLFSIIKSIGGTEIIYLAYGAPCKLSQYLEDMAWENESYEKIKKTLIQEFGQPITDYSKLNYSTLNYDSINEFYLDDFSDLK